MQLGELGILISDRYTSPSYRRPKLNVYVSFFFFF